MAQFLPAFDFMIVNEDATRSWAAITDNDGGVVIAGVNSKSFPHDLAAILSLPQGSRGPAVQMFYLNRIWAPAKFGGLESQDVADRAFDQEVNSGHHEAVTLLQRACNALRAGLSEDGALGPLTLEAANAADPESLLAAYRAQRVAFYEELLAKNPIDEKYREGWLSRARK